MPVRLIVEDEDHEALVSQLSTRRWYIEHVERYTVLEPLAKQKGRGPSDVPCMCSELEHSARTELVERELLVEHKGEIMRARVLVGERDDEMAVYVSFAPLPRVARS